MKYFRIGACICSIVKHNELYKTQRWLSIACSQRNAGKTEIEITKYQEIQAFFRNEPDFVARLNNDFALPFTDINVVFSQLQSENKKDNHLPVAASAPSPLYKFFKQGLVRKPAIDFKYICDNPVEVAANFKNRKILDDFCVVKDIIEPYKRCKLISEEIAKYRMMDAEVRAQLGSISSVDMDVDERKKLQDQLTKSKTFAYCIITILSGIKQEVEAMLYSKASLLPNETHQDVPVGETATLLDVVGEKPKFDFEIHDHIFIAEKMNFFRQHNIATLVGKRNYYLMDAGAELEHALIRYTLDKLKMKNFIFFSTPNMLRDVIFEGCGLEVDKFDQMVYRVRSVPESNFCLAGTSELGFCAYFTNHSLSYKDLPLRLCAVSTCYRKETGTRLDPRGLFRVHQFQKVEMFGLTANETGKESADLHAEFVSIQKELFEELGLHFQVLDMPTDDLGLPAHRKVDIEAWFPGRGKYDEISSASNCTDFQSRRLNILYNKGGDYHFAHTVNATACATTRMIMALLENGQQKDRTVLLPECLQPYMYGKRSLRKQKHFPMKYVGLQQKKKNYVIPT